MLRKTYLLLIVLMLALPNVVLAQDQTEEEETQYDCPAFTSASTTERTSYYMGEGAAFLRSGNYSAAINAYGCIVQQIDPNFRDAYLNRAAAYSALRSFEEALEDYDQAAALDSSFAPTFNNRGIIYTAIQEYEDALSDFDRALELNSQYDLALINRGIVRAIEGDFDLAQADFEAVISNAELEAVVTDMRDPERDPELPRPEYDMDAVDAYALIGIVHSQRALTAYSDYLLLAAGRADGRIQSAAGALESRFQFELRLDDGSWMLMANFVDG